MSLNNKQDYIVYIGDFDFRNGNVQSFLVKNNAKIFQSIGYNVAFIGINTKVNSFKNLDEVHAMKLVEGFAYYELPCTLNARGFFKVPEIRGRIIDYLNGLLISNKIKYLISYQCPSFSFLLNSIIKWCRLHSVKYIVNCADLPTFDIQPIPRRYIMAANWFYLHWINKRKADGIIAVSKCIADFYHKEERSSIIVPPLFDATAFTPLMKERTETASFVYAGTPFKITGREANVKGMKDRLDKVIDLFLKLKDQNVPFFFKIVGIEKEDYLIGVPRHKEPLADCRSIEFLGLRSHNETLTIVSNADYSINYRDENLMTKAGFSTKIVESISVGTPIVMNSISDTFEYVEEGIMGFMLLGESSSDIRLMKRLCSLSKEKRTELKQFCLKCRAFSIDKYKWGMKKFIDSL